MDLLFYGLMRAVTVTAARLVLMALLAGTALAAGTAHAAGTSSTNVDGTPSPKRGEYLLRAAGGCGCHTDTKHDGPWLAGGRPIKTPFGTFYSTNLTPHRKTGLGAWSEADFVRAMTLGISPDGVHYFPVFPYTSFSALREADLKHLWAYLRSVPPVNRPNRPHDVPFPFNLRLGAWAWKWLNFSPAPFREDPARPAAENRGAYLATALGHCGECHTPRNLLGALKTGMHFAGSVDGPEGELAPNITPHQPTGIGEWSGNDLVWFLEMGAKPDGDDVQGLMAEAIEHGFQYLTEADRRALAAYLRALPPIDNKIDKPEKQLP